MFRDLISGGKNLLQRGWDAGKAVLHKSKEILVENGKALALAVGGGVASFLFGGGNQAMAASTPYDFNAGTLGADAIVTSSIGALSPYLIAAMVFGAGAAGLALVYHVVIRRGARAGK